jgi:two-component system OmpR family sensor kinase
VRSIRTRLTTAYAAAMIATLVLYSLALLTVRRMTLMDELRQRVENEADQVVRAVNLARSSGTEPVVAEDDPLAGPRVSVRMRAFLSLLEGYVLVQDSTGYDIYASPAVQALSLEARDAFSESARRAIPNARAQVLRLRDDEVLVSAREVPLSKDARYRVVAGRASSSRPW